MSSENPKFGRDEFTLVPRGADSDVAPDEPSREPLPKVIQCDERVVYEGVRSALAHYTPKRQGHVPKDTYRDEVAYLLFDGNTPPEDFFKAVNGDSTPVA